MPRGQKQAHYAEDEVPDDFYETERITKCSLSSLCHPGDRDVRRFLEEAIVYCSQLRVVISIVAKHHIFATLKEQAEEATRQGIPNTLPFEPDQKYYSRVKTMIVDNKLLKSKGVLPSYYASLQSSRNEVLTSLYGRDEYPAYEGQLSKTTIGYMMGYYVKQLAENLSTHVKTHANDCVKNWLNNQLRAQLTDEQYTGKNHRRHIGRLKRDLSSNSLAEISAAHQEYKEQLTPAFRRELSPNSLSEISAAHKEYELEREQLSTAKPPSTADLVSLFWRLRLDIDYLEASTQRPMKLMAVVPEAQMRVKFAKIDRHAAQHMVKDIYKSIYGEGAIYNSEMTDEEHWETLINLQKVKRLRGNARFGFSILTDGVAACVLFKVLRPSSERPVRKRTRTKMRADAQARDITGPGLYSVKDHLTGEHTHLPSFDPGVHTVLTGVRLDKPDGQPFKLSQAEYRQVSMLNWKMKKLGSHTKEFKKWMGGVMETLTNAPSKKSVLRYSEYLRQLGEVWDRCWAYHVRKKLRRIQFYAWRRREAWMTKLVSRVKEYAGGGPIIFGKGADSGLFGRVRGAGVKGPVLEIKKRLSEHMPVIEASEFRTSKLCLDCGRVAKFFNHSVTFCTDRDHHRMANRDVAAAKKIGALYLAMKKELDLGPWSQDVSAEEVNQGRCLSTVLRDVLYTYGRGEYRILMR